MKNNLSWLIALAIIPISSVLPAQSSQPNLICTKSEENMLESFIPPTSLAEVEIVFKQRQLLKPPLTELFFDITLRNKSSEPRWFILPANLSSDQQLAATLDISSISVYEPKGQGRGVISYMLGYTGYYMLLLPGSGEVTVRLWPFSYWEELAAPPTLDFLEIEEPIYRIPEGSLTKPTEPQQDLDELLLSLPGLTTSVLFKVLVGSNLTIDGKPAEALLGNDFMSNAKVDANHPPDRYSNSVLYGKSVSVSLEPESCLELEVDLVGGDLF